MIVNNQIVLLYFSSKKIVLLFIDRRWNKNFKSFVTQLIGTSHCL